MLEDKKILVLSSISTFPVTTGGHSRSHGILTELAKKNEVRCFVPVLRRSDFPRLSSYESLAPGYLEHRDFCVLVQVFAFVLERFGLFWIAYYLLSWLLRRNWFVRHNMEWADVVILNFPFLSFLIPMDGGGKVIYHISHNHEFDLFSVRTQNSFLRSIPGSIVHACEKRAIVLSKKTFACSIPDIEAFGKTYGHAESLCLLPNGIADSDSCIQIRDVIDSTIAPLSFVFLGSNYWPNIDAANWIVHELAPLYPQSTFHILWAVGDSVDRTNLSENVHLTGRLEEEVLKKYLDDSDIALNPILSGGGSSLKIGQYVVHGLPIISTVFGLRWYEAYPVPRIDLTNVARDLPICLEWISQNKTDLDSFNGKFMQSHSWNTLCEVIG